MEDCDIVMNGFGEEVHEPFPEPSMSLEQAISLINIRKQNLDHIYGISIEAQKSNATRDGELERVLEILSQVRP